MSNFPVDPPADAELAADGTPLAPLPPLPGDDDGTTGPGNAWWWAAGLVLLAVIVAGLVFVLATRNPTPQPAPPALLTPTAVPNTASPLATATPTATATATAAPTPTSAPTAAPTAVPTPQPVALTPTQQAAVLFPGTGSACGGNGHYDVCPVTQALVNDANAWRSSHGPSSPEPLCRCPINYKNPTYVQNDSDLPAGLQGNTAYAAVEVQLWFQGPPDKYETMVVIFSRASDGTWLANDTYCDNPQNKLSADSPQACSVH